MVQLFWVLLVWLIVSLPFFQVTWGFFRLEFSSNLHVSSTLVGLAKEIFFSDTPIKSLKTFNEKTYFLILGEQTSEAVLTYTGLQVDTGALYILQGKKAPAKSEFHSNFRK